MSEEEKKESLMDFLETWWASPECKALGEETDRQQAAATKILNDSGFFMGSEFAPWGACPLQLEMQLKTGEFIYFRSRGGTALYVFKNEDDFKSGEWSKKAIKVYNSSESYLSPEESANLLTGWIEDYLEKDSAPWVLPGEYEMFEKMEEELKKEKIDAIELLIDSDLFTKEIEITDCHIPKQIFSVLRATNQTCYVRDNRRGQDPTLYVFSRVVTLPDEWNEQVYQKQDIHEEYMNYIELAKEMIRMVQEYLEENVASG